jgi:hypothetical protein
MWPIGLVVGTALGWLGKWLFLTCHHKKLSFPITIVGNRPLLKPSKHKRTYVVCLQCGMEFDYDWKNMRFDKGDPNVRKPRTNPDH